MDVSQRRWIRIQIRMPEQMANEMEFRELNFTYLILWFSEQFWKEAI